MDEVAARLCSRNEHKLRELQAALPGWRIGLLDADGFPEEEGESYEENARAKARFGRAAAAPGEWVIGEDSGLEVEALGGRPGVHSSRWAGAGEDHVEKLLARLEGVESRRARYVCAIVAISPEGDETAVQGTLAGRIAAEPRGSEGFGYDPVFVPEGEERTVAELGDVWKRRSSHRARAARALVEALS